MSRVLICKSQDLEAMNKRRMETNKEAGKSLSIKGTGPASGPSSKLMSNKVKFANVQGKNYMAQGILEVWEVIQIFS